MVWFGQTVGMEQRALEKGININAIAQKVRDAVRKGKLIRPTVCSQCGQARHIEGHHKDYALVFDVTWLCNSCHKRIHCGGFVAIFNGEAI